MSIADWMPTLKTNIAAVTGITQAHTYLDIPGTIQAFPTAIIMPVGGQIAYSVGGPKIEMTDVQITLYVSGQILPEAMGLAVPFIALIRDKLAGDVQLGGTVQYILPAEDWFEGPGGIQYGDKQLVGIIFRYIVKENVTADFAVAA